MIGKTKKGLIRIINRIRPADPEKAIVVAGSPRSGTTWLSELLQALPGYKFLNEPLLLPNSPMARDLGLEWRTHIQPNEEHADIQLFFEQVLSGQISHGPLWHYKSSTSIGRLIEHASSREIVIKFCRAGRLLHWLHQTFQPRGIVLLIRHPCAVIASMMTHGGWSDGKFEIDFKGSSAFGGRLPESIKNRFSGVFEKVETKLDVMATTWALDYFIPLIEHANCAGEKKYPWVLVPYERLVLDGASEMKRVFDYLDAEVPESLEEKLDSASAYASNDLSVTDEYRQLSKWKTQLSPDQVNRILEIVSAFHLDFYTREVEPDYDQLSAMQTKWQVE